jgi:Fe-S-cluster-containing dehydrogenase component
MTGNILEFKVRSGGTVTIALDQCVECETKACLAVCEVQGGPLVLDEGRDVPGLRRSLTEIERGGCVECMGCELDCELYGRQAVTIDLPLERFDEYLNSLAEPVVYKYER